MKIYTRPVFYIIPCCITKVVFTTDAIVQSFQRFLHADGLIDENVGFVVVIHLANSGVHALL